MLLRFVLCLIGLFESPWIPYLWPVLSAPKFHNVPVQKIQVPKASDNESTTD